MDIGPDVGTGRSDKKICESDSNKISICSTSQFDVVKRYLISSHKLLRNLNPHYDS